MSQRLKGRLVPLLVSLLLCFAAFGCDRFGDQTEQANKLVDEMNALKQQGSELVEQATAKDEEMRQKDVEKQGDDIKALAKEQAGNYERAATLYRQAASKADEATKLKIDDWFKNYLSLKSQQFGKVAEILDVAREESELWLNTDSIDEIADKKTETARRAQQLSQQVGELNEQVKKIEEEHKNDIKKEQEEKEGKE